MFEEASICYTIVGEKRKSGRLTPDMPVGQYLLECSSSHVSRGAKYILLSATMSLAEVDALEATIIIDNELDPLSPAAPDTVTVGGHMGSIAMGSMHDLTDRGNAIKELRMDNICCAAHGLSILVVSVSYDLLYRIPIILTGLDGHQRRPEALSPLRCRTRRRHMGAERQTPASRSVVRRSHPAIALASRSLRFNPSAPFTSPF